MLTFSRYLRIHLWSFISNINNSALSIAVDKGNIEIVQLLLENEEICINSKDI